MSKVLVVGGNGFIGSHVVDALMASGEHEVTAFDTFSGPHNWLSEGVSVFEGNVQNVGDLQRAVNGKEVVLDFWSATDPAAAEGDPTLDFRVNVPVAVSLLQACVDHGVDRFYFQSSGGAIYGDRECLSFSESDETRPISPYGIGKLAIERYMEFFERKCGIRTVSLRLSNPYGPRQSPYKSQGVVPIFLDRVRRGLPLKVMGDGSMFRDYIYVADLARIVEAMVVKCPEKSVYNVGSGRAESVNEIVEAVASASGMEPKIEYVPIPASYVHGSLLDVSRLNAEFGSFGLTDLNSGVEATWRFLNGAPN